MSVAENPVTESIERNPQQQLAVGSAIGAVALLAGLWFIFGGLPMLWSMGWDQLFADNPDLLNNVFLKDALLILLDLVVIGVLTYAAYTALQPHSQRGLRAGIIFMAIWIFATLWISAWLGSLLDAPGSFQDSPGTGLTVIVLIVGALLAGAGYVYAKVPGWLSFLEAVEHQGWFHAYAYKGNQGVRVRRGSIIGVLAVGACGIITLVSNSYFGRERPDPEIVGKFLANDFYWYLPYSEPRLFIPLMFKIHLMLPIVLGVLLFWVAWRVVNIPGFADFLIATEAEMNKVSWTNRRRLFQDTIVVLTTVFLFTAFLFIVDVIWIKVLSLPGIQVLMVDTKAEQLKQQEKAQW